MPASTARSRRARARQSVGRARRAGRPSTARRPGRRSCEHLGDREVRRVGAAHEVLDRDDAGHSHAVARPRRVHDDVDGVAHERAERGERQVASDVGELAEESQPAERLGGRARVDRRVAGDPRRQREQQRERLTVSDLTDDRDVGSHAQEPGDESTQVDLRSVGAGGSGLHLRDVGQRDVGLEHLLGHHDAQRRIELGEAAREQRRLPRSGRAGEHDRRTRPHARAEERRHDGLDRAACRRARRASGSARR